MILYIVNFPHIDLEAVLMIFFAEGRDYNLFPSGTKLTFRMVKTHISAGICVAFSAGPSPPNHIRSNGLV